MNEWLKENHPALYLLFAEFTDSEIYAKSEMIKQLDNFSFERSKDIERLVGKEASREIDNHLGDGYYREAVGFISGYQYATRIMAECIPSAARERVRTVQE